MISKASGASVDSQSRPPRVWPTSGLANQPEGDVVAATLTYFGPNFARQLGMAPAALRAELGDAPFLSSTIATSLGATAIMTLPMTFADMIRDRSLTIEYGQAALDQARSLGARYVSLSGLLASALDYGGQLDAPSGTMTTGHATTAASILRTTEAVLGQVARRWQSEVVAVLGVGSIGQTVVVAALDEFGPPRRLVLADLPAKRSEIARLVESVGADHPELQVDIVDASASGKSALYAATLVIGSTSTPNVLRPEALAPGCIVIDDSVPHCFHVDRAFARAATAKDILLANGGALRLPHPYVSTSEPPALLREALDWPEGRYRGSDITSCILAPLMMAQDPSLPATLGKRAPLSAVQDFAAAMNAGGITAPPIRCKGRTPTPHYIDQFTERFSS